MNQALHDRQFYRPRQLSESHDRFPFGKVFAFLVLIAVLVGAAYHAGEVSGYNLGYFDAEHNITIEEQ